MKSIFLIVSSVNEVSGFNMSDTKIALGEYSIGTGKTYKEYRFPAFETRELAEAFLIKRVDKYLLHFYQIAELEICDKV